MMQHADSRVLLKHYLSHQINADTRAIVHGLEPQRDVVKSMCSLGSSINKRRPIELTADQSASVNSDPRVQELVLRRDKLRTGSRRSAEARRKYKLAVRDVNNEKARLRKALKDKIREEFDAKQAVIDIERQLAGIGFDDTDTNPPTHDPLPAHQRLLEAVCAPMDCKTLEELYQRRDAAIDAVAAYCAVEEDWSSVRCAKKASKLSVNVAPTAASGQEPPEGSLLHEALISVFKDGGDKSYRCFLCVGKALLLREAGHLQEDDRAFKHLTHEFHSPGDVTKHFRRRHLRNLRAGQVISCTACSMPLDHKEHLQNHARRIHGTVA